MGANTYNDFKQNTPIPGDATDEEIKFVREFDKRAANKMRSLANKHRRAYLRGKGETTLLKRGESGILETETIKVTSNEFGVHKKV